MYIKTCAGGYPNPLLAGKYEILGFRATVTDPTKASRVILYDDMNIETNGAKTGYIYPVSYNGKTKIVDCKGESDVDDNIEVIFPESLKTRKGLSAAFENILAGTFMLYVK